MEPVRCAWAMCTGNTTQAGSAAPATANPALPGAGTAGNAVAMAGASSVPSTNAGNGGNPTGAAAGMNGSAGMSGDSAGSSSDPGDDPANPDPGSANNAGASGSGMNDAAGSGGAPMDPDPGSDPAEPPLADYQLVVDAPADGDTISGDVTVRGRAPAFLNVEVWDANHHMPPLAQVVPDADGHFELTVDTSALPSGQTTWTVYAWDSPPGQSFTHTANVALQLEITGSASADPCAGQTCSGHGSCSSAGGSALCSCASGYHAVGLTCVANTSSGDGQPDPGTSYVPAGYSLVFNDEFDGSALDTGKWNTLGPWGVQWFSDSNQKQAFVPEAVSLNSGVLTFTANRADGSKTNGQPYSSGSITTKGTFTYGYFETRTRVPAGKGFWPAYWVTSSTRWPPEWDIFEIINNVIYGYPHPIESGQCSFVEGAAGSDSTYTINNLYGVYHVYGFLWTASDIYWYVDGVLTEHYAINAAAGANDPFWLNISLQVGGDWPGDPDGSTPFPAHMDVDYMRVYQKN